MTGRPPQGELVGVKLRNGPGQLEGWQQVYDSGPLGGWPLPERIAVFEHMGSVGVCLQEDTNRLMSIGVDSFHMYDKVGQSKLPEPDPTGIIVRGAEFVLVVE